MYGNIDGYVEENFVPEQQTPAGWQVERLILKSPTGDEMEIPNPM